MIINLNNLINDSEITLEKLDPSIQDSLKLIPNLVEYMNQLIKANSLLQDQITELQNQNTSTNEFIQETTLLLDTLL